MARIDYDAIAHLYDSQPFRTKDADPNLRAFLEERRASPSGARRVRALDLGCGTGNQQVANQAAFPDVSYVGADLFLGMLRQAAAKSRAIAWLQCDGIALPFRAGAFDFVSDQYSLHHVKEKRRLFEEVHRVLAPGGRFVLQNICPERMRDALQYRYFPESRELDDRDFLPIATHEAWLRQSGFEGVRAQVDVRRWERPLPLYAKDVRRRDLNSSLQAVTDDGYTRGVAAIDRDVANGAVLVKDEVALLTVVATRPMRG